MVHNVTDNNSLINLYMENENKNQVENINNSNKKLLLSDVIKSVCVHEWKVISYYNPSCCWVCKKCGKTVL